MNQIYIILISLEIVFGTFTMINNRHNNTAMFDMLDQTLFTTAGIALKPTAALNLTNNIGQQKFTSKMSA